MLGVYLLAQLIVPRQVKDPRKSGVVVQGVFRTNFAILGVPLMQSIFGQAGMATVTLGLPPCTLACSSRVRPSARIPWNE